MSCYDNAMARKSKLMREGKINKVSNEFKAWKKNTQKSVRDNITEWNARK